MMARKCDACGNPLPNGSYVEIGIRRLSTLENNSQDDKGSVYGDYCAECIENGNAIRDALASMIEEPT